MFEGKVIEPECPSLRETLIDIMSWDTVPVALSDLPTPLHDKMAFWNGQEKTDKILGKVGGKI